MAIIGISGKMGVGKDTVAELIAKHIKINDEYIVVRPKLFALNIKRIVEILSGVSLKWKSTDNFDMPTMDYTQEQKEILVPEYNMTIGNMLQQIGTNIFREHFDKDVWVKSLFSTYGKHEMENEIWIITDVRFPNEADFIKELGGTLIRIVGDPKKHNVSSTRDPNHPTEIALDDYNKWNYVIYNNGSLKDLDDIIKDTVTDYFRNKF